MPLILFIGVKQDQRDTKAEPCLFSFPGSAWEREAWERESNEKVGWALPTRLQFTKVNLGKSEQKHP